MLDQKSSNITLPSGPPSEATNDRGLTQPDHQLEFLRPIHENTAQSPFVLFLQPLGGHKLSKEVVLELLAAENLPQTL
jgi:hypothetical protein